MQLHHCAARGKSAGSVARKLFDANGSQVPRFLRLPLTGQAYSPAPEIEIGGNMGITRSVHTYGYRNSSGTFQIDVFSEFWSIKEVLRSECIRSLHSVTVCVD